MPFEVSGIVETTTFDDPASKDALWFAALHLDHLNLIGDRVSNYLFGLAKTPSGCACFPERGIPDNAGDAVRQSYRDDQAFLAAHGESNFGHTFATLEDIEHALAAPGAPTLSDSDWTQVLRAIEALRRIHQDTRASQWRVVVWANW